MYVLVYSGTTEF